MARWFRRYLFPVLGAWGYVLKHTPLSTCSRPSTLSCQANGSSAGA